MVTEFGPGDRRAGLHTRMVEIGVGPHQLGSEVGHSARDESATGTRDSLSWKSDYGYNSHEVGACRMRSVNIAKLKDELSKYLTFAKAGEEVVIRDRNLPVAKLVPFSAEGAEEQELKLVVKRHSSH